MLKVNDKVNDKDTRTTSLASFRCRYCELWTYLTPYSNFSVVNFEQVNGSWTVVWVKHGLQKYLEKVINLQSFKLYIDDTTTIANKKIWFNFFFPKKSSNFVLDIKTF